MSKLAGALLEFQKTAPSLHRDSTNPHYRNRYLSLEGLMEQVLPVLNMHGLVLMQFPAAIDGQPALRTKLLHAESGEFEEDVMPLTLAKNDPQAQGSGLTYARRYSLMAILGLVADEDDDGNAASGGEPTAQTAASRGPSVPAKPASPPETFPIPEAVQAKLPPDNGLPEDVSIHFGKNAGLKLGDLRPRQIAWYAENELRPDASVADRRLKAAAQTLVEREQAA